MKWKLVDLVPRDGMTVRATEEVEITIRGSIGKAVIVALPASLFAEDVEVFRDVIDRARETAQRVTGLTDVLAVEEGVEFFRLVPVDLDERISEALGECESCCLDDKTDRMRVMKTLKAKLIE